MASHLSLPRIQVEPANHLAGSQALGIISDTFRTRGNQSFKSENSQEKAWLAIRKPKKVLHILLTSQLQKLGHFLPTRCV